MRNRNSWCIGLLVAVAILASSPLRPAAAQCGSKCHLTDEGLWSCVFTIQRISCQYSQDYNCYDTACEDLSPRIGLAGPSARGAFSWSAADRQCSLPQRSVSAVSTEVARGQIKAVRLKART
jgi:hypothetical protein